MEKVNVLHSAKENRWGTPSDIIERARNTMGSITLDPCSSVTFNEVVRAEEFYSLDDFGQNGLDLPWKGNILLNPPGKKVKDFWRKAFQEPITQMIFIGFSVEQLALLADEPQHPLDYCFCILRKRIRFTRHDGYSGSPSHSNYIAGVYTDPTRFKDQFSPLGRVYLP